MLALHAAAADADADAARTVTLFCLFASIVHLMECSLGSSANICLTRRGQGLIDWATHDPRLISAPRIIIKCDQVADSKKGWEKGKGNGDGKEWIELKRTGLEWRLYKVLLERQDWIKIDAQNKTCELIHHHFTNRYSCEGRLLQTLATNVFMLCYIYVLFNRSMFCPCSCISR